MKIGNRIQINNEADNSNYWLHINIKVSSSIRNLIFIRYDNVFNILNHYEVR